jgi:hypothetical protein
MRFYWNPNAIIGLSMWFWFLVSSEKIKGVYLVVTGLILGFIFNLHYFAAAPLLLWFVYLFVTGKSKKGLMIILGFIFGSSPIWIFELRNSFYLSKTFLFNLTNRFVEQMNPQGLIVGLYQFPSAILGIRPMEIGFSVMFDPIWQKILGWMIFCLAIFAVLKLKKKTKVLFGVLVLASLVTAILSGNEFYGRYLFGLYPIFIWFVAISIEKIGWFGVVAFIPILFADLKIISFRPDLNRDYVDIKTLETASQIINKDVKDETYNLSENIYGDAQAMGLRFYVLKNVTKIPNDELSYEHLDSLYVLTPSLEKTLKDNRYEYYASNLPDVSWVEDVGSVKIIKFVRKN